MEGSRTILVQKRDGTLEAFDQARLAGSLLAALSAESVEQETAENLAFAVEHYISRVGLERVSSPAVFEMAVKILRSIQCPEAAERYEAWSLRRRRFRKQFRIVDDQGRVTLWDKGKLADQTKRQWMVSDRTARIVAGELEKRLMDRPNVAWIGAGKLQDELNSLVAAFGLADAVPTLGATEGR